jgi:hypothetical protein
MGSLYRSQHELVFVFKHGRKGHCNNVQLGQFGRNRSNVWRADSPLEETGFEPPVPLATEMLIKLARGITNATRMLGIGDIGRCRGCADSEVGPAVRIRFPPPDESGANPMPRLTNAG